MTSYKIPRPIILQLVVPTSKLSYKLTRRNRTKYNTIRDNGKKKKKKTLSLGVCEKKIYMNF